MTISAYVRITGIINWRGRKQLSTKEHLDKMVQVSSNLTDGLEFERLVFTIVRGGYLGKKKKKGYPGTVGKNT